MQRRSDKRAYIYLNRSCNLDCLYCASDGTNRCPDNFSAGTSLGLIVQFLETKKSECGAVVISGGEPTIFPDILEIIRQARCRFSVVQLMTNAVALSNEKFAEQIMESGVTDICISIPSPFPQTFDWLVQKDGACEQQYVGMCNIMNYAKEHPANIQFKTIIVNKAIETFPLFPKFLLSLPGLPNVFIFNGLHIGEKVVRNQKLIPNVQYAGKLLSEAILGMRDLPIKVAVAEFPLCLLEIKALEVLVESGFPVSASCLETTVIDGDKINEQRTEHIKTRLCERCLLNDFCDGFPFKNFDLLENNVLRKLRPVVGARE